MILTSSIPVLRASDYAATREFLLSLGFALSEEAGDPPRFGIFHAGAAQVFVDAWEGADPVPSPRWRAYFHTTDLDGLAAAWTAAGIAHEGPVETGYGMREVVVADPDGNRLCFGQDA